MIGGRTSRSGRPIRRAPRRGAALAGLSILLAAGTADAGPKFEDRSSALPEHVYSGGWEHFVGGGVAVFDCNDDARPDIFAAGGEAPALLLRNKGDFAFDPVPRPDLLGVTGAYPLDADADGRADLFVMRAGPNLLLRGLGDCAFEDATEAMGLPAGDAWTTAFTAWWEDDDRPVMAIGNYVDRDDPDGPFEACNDNAILRPDGDGWREETLSPGFCALSMLAARNARGQAALRISNDRHYYVRGGFEQMWDIETRRFLGEADGWPTVSLWGMGIASRDLDADGRDEVMLTSMGDQLLQLARPDGSYAAAPFSIGSYAQRPHVGDDGRPSTGWHAEFGDIDNDGRADLFIAKGNVDQMPTNAMRDPNNLLMQQADGRFAEASVAAGIATTERSRGAALADFDGDGRLDLVVVNRRAPMELWRNVTGATGHWLAIDLVQPGGNRSAIGARVTVETEAGRQVLQRVIGGGHAGGRLGPLHVGLGQATAARVTVEWPDGTVTAPHPVEADRTVTLDRAALPG
ncbi:LOW QUALITY PROTEIN: FG-GAP repeat domain protein [Limimaricola cinnabarinus LL-001]|uniref:FG-GAP repeat domain protein n=1 Tax=Limimaricola cinnabarinus LL-001 TaxID=1337093 RepID=U3AMH6_9RHOB|nr:LOW QUALITY PROTEIN: FG-GAP repeat domain protein [Limimaricola cinnabarinus LL-001]